MDADREWLVTEEKMAEAVRRIVAVADPVQVILFGSRARGDHRVESDLDLAVILDSEEEHVDDRPCLRALAGLRMSVDLVVVSRAKYDVFRPWRNSVLNYVDTEGVVLYDRTDPESEGAGVVRVGSERSGRVAVSAS